MDQETNILLIRAKSGSSDAMSQLFERVAPRLLALIRLRMGSSLRNRLESRDILQISMMKAFERLGQLKGGSTNSFMAWLARIADNEIRDQAEFHGRQRRDMALDVVPEDGDDRALQAQVHSQISQVILSDELKRLEQALETLESDYREIILLRKYEELPFNEIAKRLGKSPDACRMLLVRAMTALTLKLKELP